MNDSTFRMLYTYDDTTDTFLYWSHEHGVGPKRSEYANPKTVQKLGFILEEIPETKFLIELLKR